MRANGVCEYCLIHESDTYVGCQVEHIIAEKHGGRTEASNLAFACAFCNRAKGTDLGTILLPARALTRFFNPRTDLWTEHFLLEGASIQPRTLIGEATVKILRLNAAARLFERQTLQLIERYPAPEAFEILNKSLG